MARKGFLMKLGCANFCFALFCSSCWASETELAQQRIDRIRAEVNASYPGGGIESSKSINKALDREMVDVSKQFPSKSVAAGGFLGYYTKYVIGVPRVCSDHGIRVASFPAHFAELHAPLLQIVNKINTLESVVAQLTPGAITNARLELKKIAALKTVNIQTVCEMLEANGALVAESVMFSKVAPSTYAILVNP